MPIISPFGMIRRSRAASFDGFISLTPANITDQKGYGGGLEHSPGSDSLNSANVTEILSSKQGSIHTWVKLPFASSHGTSRYVFDFGSVKLYWDGGSTQWKATVNSVDIVRSDAFSVGDWVYLLVTWDEDAPTLDLTADATSAVQVTGVQTEAAPGSTLYLGQDSANGNLLGGPVSMRISNAIESSFYGAGDGDVDMYVVGFGSVMFNFSDDDTGQHYYPFGKTVSAIVANANDATLTTATGAQTAFYDGEAIRVEGGKGDSAQAFADGDPSGDTTMLVDDGAGSAVADIEKVGVFANFNGSTEWMRASDPNFPASGILGDLTIQATIKPDGVGGTLQTIVSKYLNTGNRRMYDWGHKDGELEFIISTDGSVGTSATRKSTNASLVAGEEVHIAVSYDASGGDCFFYKNGYLLTDDSVALGNSIADKDPDLSIGVRDGPRTTWFAGGISNVALFDDIRTAAEILTSATTPKEDLSGAGNIIGQWLLDDDASVSKPDNNEGTAGGDMDLLGGDTTNYGTHTRAQAAFVSRNMLVDGSMENAGITGWAIVATPTLVDKEVDTDNGERSLHIVSAADNDGVSQTITATNGDKFYLAQRHKVTAGSFEVNVTNGGGGIETGIADAGWSTLEKIVSATGNLTFQWLGEAAADDFNISKATLNKCIAGDSLVAGLYYTRVFNVDTTNVGAEWSGLGSDATEVKTGDLYIRNDTRAATG